MRLFSKLHDVKVTLAADTTGANKLSLASSGVSSSHLYLASLIRRNSAVMSVLEHWRPQIF